MRDCFTDPPEEAGRYNVEINGVMSFLPIFWEFDGTNWSSDNFTYNRTLDRYGVAFWYPNN
jgi:hypothetical protein